MTKPEWCHRSTMQCNAENCILFVAELDQCFDEIEKDYKMIGMGYGKTSTSVERAPPTEAQGPLVADAMTIPPDISQIEWLIKGNKDARDTDAFAYAFVFKYDAAAKAATDELRPEAVELYNYLQTHDNKLVIGEFVYSLNTTKTLFARNKART